jgi:broad specificity phosphatase PhoE
VGTSSVRIVLARHGRPDLPDQARQPITGREIGRWYRAYNTCGIGGSEPSRPLREAATAGCVVASDLRRAVESAARLGPADRIRVEPTLREVGFPEALDSSLRLKPDVWVLIARAAQMLDRCECDERIDDVRARAAAAARTLVQLAGAHRTVVAVGHGWFNQFVARELRRGGWQGPRFPPTGYWLSATYRR